MRYFFYTTPNRNRQHVVKIDETTICAAEYFPPMVNWPVSKAKILQLRKDQRHLPDARVFEICENQFKKFKDKGIMPINFDW